MRFFLVLLFLLVSIPAMAASFDCAKATHIVEKMVCDDEQVSSQDETLAELYAKARDRVFDQQGLRDSQTKWMERLRDQCTARRGCTVPDLEYAYDERIFFLQNVNEESYEANYKTNDVAVLDIYHIDGNALDINLSRKYLNAAETDKPICRLPASDDDPGVVATMKGDNKATWSEGGCTIDFILHRDTKGSVTAIDVVSSEACKRYCTDGYNLGTTNFIPLNNWLEMEITGN